MILNCILSITLLSSPIVSPNSPALNRQYSLRAHPLLTIDQLKDFPAAVAALTEQANCSFIISEPPAKGKLGDISLSRFNEPTTLNEAVRLLAEAYDYDFTIRGRIVILRRLYKQAIELPLISRHEYLSCMKDISGILHSYSPPVEAPDHYVLDILNGLTPDQLASLQKGEALRVADLTPAQNELVLKMAIHLYVGSPVDDADRSLSLLQAADDATLRSPKDSGTNPQVFMKYRARDNQDIEFPLYSPKPEDANSSSQSLQPYVADSAPLPPHLLFSRRLISTTVGNLVTVLNKSINPTTKNGSAIPPIQITVEDCLKDRSVLICGNLKQLSLREFIAALATAHRLRVIAPDQYRLRIARLAIKKPGDITEIPIAIRSALPETLLVASGYYALSEINKKFDEARQKADGQAIQELQNEKRKIESRMNQLINISGLTLQSYLKSLFNPNVPLLVHGADLHGTEDAALGYLLSVSFLSHLDNLLQSGLPSWIKHYDLLSLEGGIKEEGNKRFGRITFVLPNPSGQLVTVASIFHVPMPDK